MTTGSDIQPARPALRRAVREIEAHVAEAGWDRPGQLFALVPTTDLLSREPALASRLQTDLVTAAGALTPVEQEPLPPGRPFEQALEHIMWPAEVAGAGAVVERVVLPGDAESAAPQGRAQAESYAAEHPHRQDIRVAVGVLRDGQAHCVLRLRAHDSEEARLEGPDLVPNLVQLLAATLQPDSPRPHAMGAGG